MVKDFFSCGMYRSTFNFFSGRGHIPFLLDPTRYKKFEGEDFFFFKFLR